MPVANPFHLRGVYVPLLTPFQPDGELDPPALERLVDYVLAAGVHGLFVGGTTGEFPLLSTAERQRVAEVVVARAACWTPGPERTRSTRAAAKTTKRREPAAVTPTASSACLRGYALL